MALKYLWNETKDRSIKVSQVKEFSIVAQGWLNQEEKYLVRAYISNSDFIVVVSGLSKLEAVDFIGKLVEEIAG